MKQSQAAHTARNIRDQLEALDYAIRLLRKSGETARADKIACVRDYLSRSDAYHRSVMQVDERRADFRKSREIAEVMWSNITRSYSP